MPPVSGAIANSRTARIAIVWAAATLLMLPAFISGHIIADNSYLNVNWSQGFVRALFAGNFYPRWLPQMNAGAGSAVFYFYAPLPFYLTAPFHLIAGPRLALLLGSWLMLGLSGQSFYALARRFTAPLAALVSALAYMAMPYHLLADVWLRADVGEQAAYIFTPLCLLGIFNLDAPGRWPFALAASIAGLLLSHLPTALLVAPLLVGMCLFVGSRGNFVAVMARAAAAAVLGVGLAAAYVLPAMLLLGMIHADNWSVYRPADNLLFSNHPIAFDLFLDAVAATTAFVAALLAIVPLVGDRWRLVAPWAVVAAAVLFLVSPGAAWLWNALPAAFDRIQFSWRSLILLDVATCMLLAQALDKSAWNRFALATTLSALVTVAGLFVHFRSLPSSSGFIGRPAALEDELIAEQVDVVEFLPSCLQLQSVVETNILSVSDLRRLRARRTAEDLSTLYYPFLDAYRNGLRITSDCDPASGLMRVGPHVGPIEVVAHALPVERAGYALSLSSLAVLLLCLFLGRGSRWPQVLTNAREMLLTRR